jgi:hypothetical protein
MKRRFFAFLLLCVAVLSLTGCTSFVGVENLLSPPALEGDQQEIYTALCKTMTSTPDLIYPVKGNYRSAITILNIDKEETEEAIAFYSISASATTGTNVTMPLRVNVLDKQDGEWVSVYEMGIDADEIEKIDLLHTDDAVYLVIGYNYSTSSEKLVQAYQFKDHILSMVKSFSAINYEVCDLDEDGADEIVKLVSKTRAATEETPEENYIEAQLVQVTGKQFMSSGFAAMYPTVTEYAAVNIGKLYDGKTAIYLDGIVGSQMISEILFCDDDGKLENLIYTDDPELAATRLGYTQRQSGIYSQDINGDGIYEIPQTVVVTGYEDKERYEQVYYTCWRNFTQGGGQHSYMSYTDYSLGYVFRLPTAWDKRVTLEVSSADHEVTFYEYDAEGGERGLPILSIRVMSRSDYESDDLHGKYSELTTSGQLVFLYYSHNDISSFALSDETVKNSLYLLN